MAVAEYFRDQGLHVCLFVDSVTRHCEAHREVALAQGEAANLRGFPASTAAAIAKLCERAGPGAGQSGDITGIFSVLVAGSDMEEPVADMLRGVLDGHVVLDRVIAERGRFPAIDVVRSVSRALPAAANPQENSIIADARQMMATYDSAALMIQTGLYQLGADPTIDRAVGCRSALEDFVSLKDGREALAHFAKLRQALSTSPMRADATVKGQG
jgi:flagellum-specific ATP synthase